MESDIDDALMNPHNFDIAAIRLNIRANQVDHGANPLEECVR